MTKEMIEIIIKCVAMLLAGYITYYVKPWLIVKVGEAKLKNIEKAAVEAVRSAEQLYGKEEFELKKKYALEYVAKQVGKLGVDMDILDIEALVESTVNLIKYGMEYKK